MKQQLSDNFFKSVLVLMGGTVTAQLINIALTPVITRLYSPEELGTLGFYLRIVTFFAAIVTLRLELSLPIERLKSHRFLLYTFTVKWTLILSLLLGVPVGIYLLFGTGNFVMNCIALTIPIGVLFHGYFNLGAYWELSLDRFSKISFARLIQALFTNLFKIIFGLLSFGKIGLIFSVLFGLFSALVIFIKTFLGIQKDSTSRGTSKRTRYLLYKHRDLFYFNLPHVLVDLLRDMLFAILILYMFSESKYGLFDHSFRMLKLPLVFIGAAVGQVLFIKSSKKVNSQELLGRLTMKIVIGLTVLSLLPFLLINVYGTEIFSFVFGNEWADSGKYGEIIAWWLMLNFITSPLSYLPVLLNRQRIYFIINLIGTLLLLASIFIPLQIDPKMSFERVLLITSFVQVIFNLFMLFFFGFLVKRHDAAILNRP